MESLARCAALIFIGFTLMRISSTYVALIVGGALGVLAVAVTVISDERAGDAHSSANARPFPAVTKEVTAGTSLIRGNAVDPVEVSQPEGELEENENARVSVDRPISGSRDLPVAGTTGSFQDLKSAPHAETGRFRSSASVQERCRTRPVPTSESCGAMSKFLEELAREERDVEWATQTEARIRAVIAARQDGTLIRALECRYSKCAIETESPGTHQHLSIFRQAEQEAAGVVDDGNYVLAWEEDPARGAITITEVSFTRRFQ